MANRLTTRPSVTVCLLTYGNYLALARRAIESIRANCERRRYRLVVGANAVGAETRAYLEQLHAEGALDRLIISDENLNKCPMMRRMFEAIETEYIWWFDDDSHIIEPAALGRWLGHATAAPPSTVMWGSLCLCNRAGEFTDLQRPADFVRAASWYRGLPPPAWRPGGKGEFNFRDQGSGDGRWFFIVGGCWLIRTRAVRELDWPDARLVKLGDDVFLGEAIRQQGWTMENIGCPGVAINTIARRGDAGSNANLLAGRHNSDVPCRLSA